MSQSIVENAIQAAPVDASALANVAANLKAGQFAELPTINLSVFTGGAHNGNAQPYADSMAYDPGSGKIFFIGGDHNARPALYTFDIASNTWTKEPQQPWMVATSHGYDHTVVDPATGTLYHLSFNSRVGHAYDIATKTWSEIARVPEGVDANWEITSGVSWFPELGKMVVLNDRTVVTYDPETNSWEKIAEVDTPFTYHTFAEYNSVHKVVIFGGGNGDDRAFYKMDAEGHIVQLAKAPVDLGILRAVTTVDPVSGDYLVFTKDQQFYSYDITTDTWTLEAVGADVPIWTRGVGEAIVSDVATYLPEYGVSLIVKADQKVYLYKHDGEGAPDQPPAPNVLATVTTTSGQVLEFNNIELALREAPDGSTVTIKPGSYVVGASITANNLTIIADGVHLHSTAREGKALLVIKGQNTTIQGVEISDVSVADENGAAFRLENDNLTLRNVYIHGNQEGLLGGGGTVLIENSRFIDNGFGGRAHGLYIDKLNTTLIIRNSDFLSSVDQGHEIKSRGAFARIENSRIGSLDGLDSAAFDFPNGGIVIIDGSVIEEGRFSSNTRAVGYGHEGILHANNSLTITNTLFIYDGDRPGTVRWVESVGGVTPVFDDNVFVGGGLSQVQGADSVYFASRAEAGLPAYPFLPAAGGGTPTPVNHVPVVVNDAVTLDEDTSSVINVLANDRDPDGDTLAVTGVGRPANGTATLNGDGTVTYTPTKDYFGTDSFTYTVSDGRGGTATGAVTLTVRDTPDNRAPVTTSDAVTLDEDTSKVITVLANDRDPDGDPLTITRLSQPGHGTVTLNGNGTVTYTPTKDYFGTDSFTYTVSDGRGGAANGNVTLTVRDTPEQPTPTPTPTPQPTGGHTATLLGNTRFVADPVRGQVVKLDGYNDSLRVADTPDLRLSGSFTISAWVNSDDASPSNGPEVILVKGGGWGENYLLAINGDEIEFGFASGGRPATYVTQGVDLKAHTWHHITGVFDNTANTVKIYVDGVQVLSATETRQPDVSSAQLNIGMTLANGYRFGGKLDDVRIYDKALSGAQVGQLAHDADPGVRPLARYAFDETSGRIAQDTAGVQAKTGQAGIALGPDDGDPAGGGPTSPAVVDVLGPVDEADGRAMISAFDLANAPYAESPFVYDAAGPDVVDITDVRALGMTSATLWTPSAI